MKLFNRIGLSALLIGMAVLPVASCMRRGEASGGVAESATTTAATAAAKSAAVEIDNFVFRPRQLTVAVGTRVTWTNKDDVPHTATSADDAHTFDSKALDTDDKYSFTFTAPGTYGYFCKVHPHMTGVVIVK